MDDSKGICLIKTQMIIPLYKDAVWMDGNADRLGGMPRTQAF